MELRHLRYFVAVAEERSFTRAAGRLHIAQPAVSAQIKSLEEELGLALLHRDRHHVELTTAGAAFLRGTRSLLADLDGHIREARRLAEIGAGRLAIGFVGSQSHEWMPQVLRSFRREHPGVELSLTELVPSEQMDALLEKRLDVGFMGPLHGALPAGLRAECIVEEAPVVAVPPDHPLAGQEAVTLKRLRDESFIFTSQQNAPNYRAWLQSRCQAAGFTPRVVQEVDRARTTLQYIAAGFGISIVGEHLSRMTFAGVCFLRLLPAAPRLRYGVAWRAHGAGELVRRFVQHTHEVFGRRLQGEN